MLGAVEVQEQPPDIRPGDGFQVFAQKVDFDIDLAHRSLKGKTEITIQPTTKDLKTVRLNCRQCRLTRVSVEGRAASLSYDDPYERLSLHRSLSVNQYHFLRKRTQQVATQKYDELSISIPRSISIEEVDPDSSQAEEIELARGSGAKRDEAEGMTGGDGTAIRRDERGGTLFRLIKIEIEFVVEEFRDGIHFAGLDEGDCKYPHAYTRNSPIPGKASCIFPCVDNTSHRCVWEISVRCPKTLGDAFGKRQPPSTNELDTSYPTYNHINGSPHDSVQDDDIDPMDLDEEEKNLDFTVVCSGEMVDEVIDSQDPSRKVVSFSCPEPVAAHHIGFAVGPFEHVDLSEYRDSDQDEMLGSNAIRVGAFALPGRAEEVRNTCMTLAGATDYFVMNFGSYPFGNYNVCFVEDLPVDTVDTASLSICSTRLLYPESILEPTDSVTRILTNTLANQWIGVHVIPSEPEDWWLIIGGALFMTDMFLQTLFGKNDYRFRQKQNADRVADSDVKRPSVYELGKILFVDPGEIEFMRLKAPSILFILNQRLIKASGRNGVPRCLHRMLLNAKTGTLTNSEISTANFMHICEKIGHMKLDVFFKQWVYGAGCPQFFVSQRFNKKKMHVEINIRQSQLQQAEATPDENLTSHNFMREVKEEIHQAYAGPTQPIFTGPMTIRIHEADGTPYEHIIEIKDVTTKAEIPYYTKYKRLKRSKRQKERAAAAAGVDTAGDAQDDVLIYCLGDVLQSEEEMRDWSLSDWPKDDEDKMSQESYEWIRMDADFEWLGRVQVAMEDYMFVSQLQQDKDVVAQVDSVRWLSSIHRQLKPLYSTILARTLADSRYFHGIRTMAANALVTFATSKDDCQWVGKTHLRKAFTEMFCHQVNGQAVSQTNDFSDRASYIMRCAIIRAMARVKDENGRTPSDIAHFFLDRLRDNDNSENDFSDNHYVATLMDSLSQSLQAPKENNSNDDDDDMMAEIDEMDIIEGAIGLINRYQRSDEWIPSYQNIYTTTALQCHLELMAKGAIPKQAADFMPYSRPENSDLVRLKALSCLTELGMLRNGTFTKFLFDNLQNDPSPFVRDTAHQILGRGLGQFATGELQIKEQTNVFNNASTHGLVVEQDAVDTAAHALNQRNKSLDLAKAGLKEDFGNNEAFRNTIASALRSTVTGISELEDLLDICSLLYDAEDKLLVKVKMPRFWRVEKVGDAQVKFKRTDKVCWERKRPKIVIPPPKPIPIPTVAPVAPQPGTFVVAPSTAPPQTPIEKKPLKLKIGNRPTENGLIAPSPSVRTPSVPPARSPASTPAPPPSIKIKSRPSSQTPAPATIPPSKSLLVKFPLERKLLKKLEENRQNGSHIPFATLQASRSSATPSNFAHPSTPASQQTPSQKRSNSKSSATPPTATAAASLFAWSGPQPSSGQPPAKRQKVDTPKVAENKARTPSTSAPSKPPSVHAEAAAKMFGAIPPPANQPTPAPAPSPSTEGNPGTSRPKIKLKFVSKSSNNQ